MGLPKYILSLLAWYGLGTRESTQKRQEANLVSNGLLGMDNGG